MGSDSNTVGCSSNTALTETRRRVCSLPNLSAATSLINSKSSFHSHSEKKEKKREKERNRERKEIKREKKREEERSREKKR